MDKIITLAELLKELDKYKHKELHVHHAWQPDHKTYSNKPDGLYWQAAMRKFHVKTNGWSDIGQHVTLLPDGRFVTGRPFNKNPASISGYNTDAFAVEMIGNFEVETMPDAQKRAIIELLRELEKRYPNAQNEITKEEWYNGVHNEKDGLILLGGNVPGLHGEINVHTIFSTR